MRHGSERTNPAKVFIMAAPDLAGTVAEHVERLGHRTVVGTDADGAHSSEAPDLVLLDARLAETTAAELRARYAVPVVLVAPRGDSPVLSEALNAQGFLVDIVIDDASASATLDVVIRMALMQARQSAARQSELQMTQERLIQSDRLASIGQLAAGVAHEINNPVGYISSNIGTLGEYVDDIFRLLDAYQAMAASTTSPEAVEHIRTLRQEIQIDFLREDLGSLVSECQEGVSRVRQIIEDLKDFSRAGEGEWETADLHRALARTLNIVHNELKYKAEVVQELGELPPIECVPSQINQVMMNLLVNAAQAIEGHGLITVRTGCDDERVWFEVEDSGRGIDAEDLKHIFDPFFTTKPVGQGTGLGLSISYGIVQRHGGSIEVDSQPGTGTRFRVTLPRQAGDKALT